jgi:hypothetical protein
MHALRNPGVEASPLPGSSIIASTSRSGFVQRTSPDLPARHRTCLSGQYRNTRSSRQFQSVYPCRKGRRSRSSAAATRPVIALCQTGGSSSIRGGVLHAGTSGVGQGADSLDSMKSRGTLSTRLRNARASSSIPAPVPLESPERTPHKSTRLIEFPRSKPHGVSPSAANFNSLLSLTAGRRHDGLTHVVFQEK